MDRNGLSCHMNNIKKICKILGKIWCNDVTKNMTLWPIYAEYLLRQYFLRNKKYMYQYCKFQIENNKANKRNKEEEQKTQEKH